MYLEKGTKGLSFGKPENFTGVRGFHNAEVYLDDVEVPVENIVVAAGGIKDLMRSFNMERLGSSTCALSQR